MEATVTLRKRKIRKHVSVAILYFLMTLLALFFVFPYLYMLGRGLMTSDQVRIKPVEIFPLPIDIGAWTALFAAENYVSYLFQTLKIVGFNIVAIAFSASLVAYGFARTKFFGKNVLFAVMLGTMMLPGIVLQTPQFIMFNSFRWIDTILPLTVPNLFGGGALYIFLIRQYMVGLPKELEEAAVIDGAGAFRRYAQIMLPLCVPVLIFIVITVFNAGWSDFYGPLIYLNSEGSETLAYAVFKDAIYTFVTPDKANLKFAGGTFMSLFPTLLFIIFQKQLIEGISTSALKG